MISIESKGDFKKTDSFLKKMTRGDIFKSLNGYGREGVHALSIATPRDSGNTADSWRYEIVSGKGYYSIIWSNTNLSDGIPVAVLIQYGHGTGNGGYVQGRDYINPAIRPIFDRIANNVWKEVTSA